MTIEEEAALRARLARLEDAYDRMITGSNVVDVSSNGGGVGVKTMFGPGNALALQREINALRNLLAEIDGGPIRTVTFLPGT